jgi:hypothetical protein
LELCAPNFQRFVFVISRCSMDWIVGLLAAGLAGAFALRQIQGTSTPYGLPVAAAVLKLPTGGCRDT